MVAADGSQSELCSPIPSDPLDQPVSNGIPVDVVTLSERLQSTKECREKLLDAKNKMSDTADMYQNDYIDRVEDRKTLTDEAKENAVMCLIDVSQKIYNLAECFQKLLDEQSDKLSEIETMTMTASASLEIASCREFRDNLKTWISKDNTPGRKPRIGRPETMVTEYTSTGVTWEKLDYSKYDRLGEGGVHEEEETGPIYSTSQAISQLTGNTVPPTIVPPSISRTSSQQSLKSQESAKNLTTSSSSLQSLQNTVKEPPSPALGTLRQDSLKLRDQAARLSHSAADIRPEHQQPNHYGSMTSLTSMMSTKSLKIAPSRPAPAPPPAKQKVRGRVYSVKNETGDGLEKPTIPPPMPPPQAVEEEHYAIPPSARMSSELPTLNEEMPPANTSYTDDEVLYDQVRSKGVPSAPTSQYQQIAIQPHPTSTAYDEDFYIDSDNIDLPPPDNLPPPDTQFHSPTEELPTPGDLPPAPPDDGFPTPMGGDVPDYPYPPEDYPDEDFYSDVTIGVLPDAMDLPPPADFPPPEELPSPQDYNMPPPQDYNMPPPQDYNMSYDEDMYVENVVRSEEITGDSGFYTEDDDYVIDRVEVLHPYTASANDELNLCVGDRVDVHIKNEDGWFEGSLNGVRGLFPGNYVQSIVRG